MVAITTEVKTMLSHLEVLLGGGSSSEDTIKALGEIEFYVHQLDNARDFDVLGKWGKTTHTHSLTHIMLLQCEASVASCSMLLLCRWAGGGCEVVKLIRC